MQISSARQPVAAAAVCLLALAACVATFVPPFATETTTSIPLMALLGIAIGVAFILHLAFLGMAARRLGRSPLWWVVVALLTFPIGSIVGLILFEWFADPRNQAVDRTQA